MKKTLILSTAMLLSLSAHAAKWNIAIGDGAGSTQEVIAQKFSEILIQETDGKIDTALFVNGQLGSEQATVNDVSMGLLDMSVVGSSNLAALSPAIGLFTYPYMFHNIEDAKTALESDVTKKIEQDVLAQANVRIVSWTYSGFRRLTNSDHPVTNMSDLKGLSVRVPKSKVILDTYKTLGIGATPIAWSETFTALQQGVVDGQETPYAAIQSMKFGEIQKYLTETHYLFQIEPVLISESLYQAQSDTVKQAIDKAGDEAEAYSYQYLIDTEDQIKKNLIENYGMQISELEDEQEWIEKLQKEVWPKYFAEVGGKERVNELLKAMGRDAL
ncbi:TRAP transporter substrate-binding protein [Vibrio kanaloae]|uniref:TRAP transporter substrate-binding protein n=1 Tax=Vibrio kanaloae TaxID=170673 RepID=A0A4U1X0G1_9VIBR|nr:TRAP transporter substrate-binding protein [Vibrio kanaloae]MCG9557066.1 TRAP transporter substrate-binding protein [Vibrio kanaloae]NOJ01180.1 TRAP transporter substrate-binding protein [Vibrio kanaloae]QPK06425.1 TRAP transporter substrate-binding protein [Vibrio kanaloae]TKF00399.1 TRAP transporter substrate-binding protein [Vibrio kanaloae]TKF14654.1 TRAP transporter substrate-binding protein [Vibrio kanaloae]